MDKNKLEQVDREIDALIKNRVELLIELAEAEKPKLRHGDYGLFNGNQPGIIHGIEMAKKVIFQHDGGEGLQERCGMDNFVASGNIFDDLTALSGDLTEFDRSDLRVEPGASNKFGFRINGACIDYHGDSYVSLGLKELGQAIRNLQIMEATMKRRKNGKS